MKELVIDFDNKSPGTINKSVNIKASINEKEILQYKFLEGSMEDNKCIWKPIQDFSEKNICKWTPKESGKYMIFVQGKSNKCTNNYDYCGRVEYSISNESKETTEKNIVVEKSEELIEEIIIDNNIVNIGEKINIEVKSNKEFVLFRFWIKGKLDWEILRDYTLENKFIYTANEAGTKEILVECKEINSPKVVDKFSTIKIEVKELKKIEITNFKCLSQNMIVNEELVFKVEANYEERRPILYKFLKIKPSGKMVCIQEYSSKSIVSFNEAEPGDYKMLCLIRDMFSSKEYDDRAIITYSIKPYEKIRVRNLSTDISSPQAVGNLVNIRGRAVGGRQILYRYIIEGPIIEDSGYIRSDEYNWEPRESGEYKITLKVKDISFKDDYEDIKHIEFQVYKRGEKPVRIVEAKCDKGRKIILGESVNIFAKIEGGLDTLCKFIVYRNGVEVDNIDYGKNNWTSFTPEENGAYEIVIMAKDSYSEKEYDSSISIYLDAKEYIPANIEYIVFNSKETYLVNESVNIEPIIENTEEILVNYITKINGYEIENTGFKKCQRLNLNPRCEGKYTITVLAKNKKSIEEFDDKKEITIYVQDVRKITSTKVLLSKDEIKVGDTVEFQAESKGGKDVCYKFYIMSKGQWVLAQNYSRKSFYTFVPFIEGEYRVLVLSKSFHKNNEYDDYDMITFNVQKM